eukprot:g3817.t1
MRKHLEQLRAKEVHVKQYDESDFLDTEEVFRRKQNGTLQAAKKQVNFVHEQIQSIAARVLEAQKEDIPAREDEDAGNVPMAHKGVAGARKRHVARQIAHGVHELSSRLTSRHVRAVIAHPGFGELCTLILKHLAYFDGASAAQVLWCFAKVQHRDAQMVTVLLEQLVPQVKTLTHQFLCMTMYALGRLNHRPSSSILYPFVSSILSLVGRMDPKSVCQCVWSLATLGHKPEEVLSALTRRATETLGVFEPSEASQLCWALARLQFRDPVLMEEIGNYVVERARYMPADGVSNIVQSFATLMHVPNEAVLSQLSALCAKELTAARQDFVVNTFWSLGALNATLREDHMNAYCHCLKQFAHALQPACIVIALDAVAMMASNVPEEVIQVLDEAAEMRSGLFRKSEVARMQVAYARLAKTSVGGWLDSEYGAMDATLDADSSGINITELPMGDIVAFLKASASRQVHPGALLPRISLEIVNRIGDLTCSDVAVVFWAYAVLGARVTAVLDTASRFVLNRREELSPSDISNCLWACGVLRYASADLLALVQDEELARLAAYSPSQLTNVAWAFSKLNPFNPGVVLVVCEEVMRRRFEGFTPTHVSTIAWVRGYVADCITVSLSEFMPHLGKLLVADQGAGDGEDTDAANVLSIQNFSAPELVDVVWGFAKTLRARSKDKDDVGADLKDFHSTACSVCIAVTRELLREGTIAQLGGQELADMVWTYSFFAQHKASFDTAVLTALAHAAEKLTTVFRAAAIASMICAFSTLVKPHQGTPTQFTMPPSTLSALINELFERRHDAMKALAPTTICNLVHALGTLRFSPKVLEDALLRQARCNDIMQYSHGVVSHEALGRMVWCIAHHGTMPELAHAAQVPQHDDGEGTEEVRRVVEGARPNKCIFVVPLCDTMANSSVDEVTGLIGESLFRAQQIAMGECVVRAVCVEEWSLDANDDDGMKRVILASKLADSRQIYTAETHDWTNVMDDYSPGRPASTRKVL